MRCRLCCFFWVRKKRIPGFGFAQRALQSKVVLRSRIDAVLCFFPARRCWQWVSLSSSLVFRLSTGFVSRCSIPSWSEFNNSSLQECSGSGVTHWQWKKTDSVLCESPTLNEDENHRHRTPSAAAPVALPPHNSIHYQKLTRCPLPQPRGLRRREREAPAPAHGNDVWRVSAKKK